MFLLKGCKETGFSFEALGTYVSFISDTYIHVRIVKILKEGATTQGSPQLLMQEGQTVLWPKHLIALYKAPGQDRDEHTNNSNGTVQ